MPDPMIHETAIVDPGAKIGAGARIWHGVHVCGGAEIGKFRNIGRNVFVADVVKIGDRCKIQNNVSVNAGVELEGEVFCGPSMVFANIRNPRAEIRKPEDGSGAAGPGAPGRHPGGQLHHRLRRDGCALCVFGAGAVITKDVEDYALWVGNPGRRIGWMCECGERLSEALTCSACGAGFARREDSGLRKIGRGSHLDG
ncbi:MAG: N-acetyltransferase [Desulfococcaceae bacterium]